MVVPGGLLLVLRFYLVDLELVMGWSLSVHIPISFSNFISVVWVVFFG